MYQSGSLSKPVYASLCSAKAPAGGVIRFSGCNMNNDLVRYSKFISLVLRHRPKLIGLVMDEGGRVSVDSLLTGMNAKGMPVDREILERVVAENDKQRFAFNTDRTKIRANQDYSIAVDLGLPPRTPPGSALWEHENFILRLKP